MSTARAAARLPRRAASPGGLVPRLTGMGAAANAMLALLVLGLVLAGVAGPRLALASRTTALRDTLSATSSLAQTMTATTTWDSVTAAMQETRNGGISRGLTAGQLDEVSGQLRGDFGRVVRMAPPGQDWAGLTSSLHAVRTELPAHGTPVKLEVVYRQPLPSHLRLVAGSFPAAPVTGPGAPPEGSDKAPFQVLVSQATARTFGLGPGSRLAITGQAVNITGAPSTVSLEVTGVMAARDPSSSFWLADPALSAPDLEMPTPNSSLWVGAVMAGAGELAALQSLLGPGGMSIEWQLPLNVTAVTGQQGQAYYNALNRLSTQTPTLAGDVAPVGGVLQVAAGPLQTVAAFLATASSVDVLLWLLYVSLTVAAVVVLLLAARMVALRRSAEMTLRRARGASMARIARTAALGAGLACVPGALAGALLAVLLVPGQQAYGGWWLPAVTLAVAVGTPAALAAWQHRLPRRRAAARGRSRARVRLVAELTAAAAAIAGIAVFRQQGTASGAGVNLYTSAAPVLVAIPAVIVVLRLYPLALRILLRGYARRRGAVAFLGLARAARVALTPALPAFALVLALSVAAFAGTVRDAITGGETAASWQAAGADVTISPVPPSSLSAAASATAGTDAGNGISAAARRAIAAVPGVAHAAGVYVANWTTPDDEQITGIAVDPAQYAALVAATQTFPPVTAATLAPGTPQPVLASPQAAADLGRGAALISTLQPVLPVRIRVAGLLSATPALPGGVAFVVLPLSALRPQAGAAPPEVNQLLLTGPGIDRARLTAVLRETVPGAVTSYRSDVYDALAGAPLQHGAFELFGLALAAAAVLGLAVMLLEIALGTAEREATLARLATMGLGERQRAWVVAWEVLPPVLAAAVAALACALVLPWVLRPAIDLSVFTGNAAVTAPLTPSAGAVLLPLAGLIVVALAALLAELRRGRRHLAASLRTGE